LASRGLKFYAITALLGFATAWASGVYLALIGFRGNPAECSSSCLLGAVPAGLGSLLVLVCGHRAFIRFLTENGSIKVKRTEGMQIGDGQEEKRVLELLREILNHKRVAKRLRNVDKLAWSEMQPWESSRFKWQGLRKPSVFIISASLRGRLDIDDWKTYLNWRYLQLNTRQTVYIAQPSIQALLPALLFIAAAASLAFNIGQYTSELFASIFGPPILLLTVYRVGPAMRKLFLRIDCIAAESLGAVILLSLFKKIDSLSLPENENAKKRQGWASRLWPEPNITERIANLQHASPSPS